MSMFTDYDKLVEIREMIKRDRPDVFFDENGQRQGRIVYGKDHGKEYAEIGWCLPAGCCVVLEDHGNNPELGVPTGVRIWL